MTNKLIYITEEGVDRQLRSTHNLDVPMTKEKAMSMEKRGVVDTDKEKTAQKKVADDAKKAKKADDVKDKNPDPPKDE